MLERIEWEVTARALRRLALNQAMAENVARWNIVAAHQLFGESDQRVELRFGNGVFLEIPNQTNAKPEKVAQRIASGKMGAPNVVFLSPIARDLAQTEAIAVADDIMVRNSIDRVAGLPVSMHFLQELDRSELAGTVVHDDVFPAPWPVDGADAGRAGKRRSANQESSAIQEQPKALL